MDSLSKLNRILENINDNGTDQDLVVRDQWFVITAWAKDVLKLDKNIHETSLNNAHKIERMEKAIDEIKPL